MVVLFTIYVVSQYICPSRQKKKRKKEKESPSKALPFSHLYWQKWWQKWFYLLRSNKNIILLERRLVAFPFFLSFFFSFFSFNFCNINFVCLFVVSANWNSLAHSLRQQSPWLFSLLIVPASCKGYKHSFWERNTFYETRHLALLAGKIFEGRERRKGQVSNIKLES